MSFAVQGWCPGALRPMVSGDGLVLRIRPHGGRLLSDQARLIADLSQEHGNGLIDLTSRANMQLRGLDQAGHRAVIDALSGAGLIDATAQANRSAMSSCRLSRRSMARPGGSRRPCRRR